MVRSQSLDPFLFHKWMEEDGDGQNLRLEDERRMLCKERMRKFLKPFAPMNFDSMGTPMYLIDDLETAFEVSYPALDSD